jgi:hypothetical protein
MSEGWGYVYGSSLRHYFKEGRSLCGSHFYFGDDRLVQGGDNQTNNCTACRLRLEQQRKLNAKIVEAR